MNSLLGVWHANPLSAGQAQRLLNQANKRRQRGLRQRHCRTCLVQEMIARHWLGENIQAFHLRWLPFMQASPHAHALLELTTGQLLISQRRQPAWQHLDRGFHLASRLFTPGDYLDVLNRHQILRDLPLSATPMPAATLQELLTTARIIKRMTGEIRPPSGSHDPTDIYG